MAYNILGVNLSHNSSVTVLSDGELVFYLEEERLSRMKRDESPYYLLIKILKEYTINEIYITDLSISSSSIYLFSKIFNNFPNIKIKYCNNHHHYTHALCAFFNSGFKEANNIVADYGGSIKETIQESESIFYFTQNSLPQKKIYKSYNNIQNTQMGITKTYSTVGLMFGIDALEGGKLMGLSSYGKKNKSLPFFFKNKKSNPNLFLNYSMGTTGVVTDNKLWPEDIRNYKEDLKTKTLSQTGKDIAYKIQQDSQEEIAKLIEIALQTNNCNNITLSGGFGLNCVNNYFLKKNFPNINFYFEPISYDGGTSMGAAYSLWNSLDPNFKPTPLKSLYLGPQYSKEQLLEGIQKYVSN